MSCDNSWNVKGNGKYKKQFIGMSGKMDKEDKLKYTYICLTSLTRAKCGTRSTLCWKNPNISGSTELFAL